MTYIEDLSEEGYVDEGPYVRAIGWLDDMHIFPIGNTPRRFLPKLRKIVRRNAESKEALGWGYFLGSHTCELCNDYVSASEIGVPAGDLLYIAPEMVSHYVEEHQYLPPQQFIDAVMKSPIPGSRKFRILAAPFRKLYEKKSQLSEAQSLASLLKVKDMASQ